MFPLAVGAQRAFSGLTGDYLGSGSYSRNFQDAFSLLSNPASLSSLQASTVGIYSEKRFMLRELSFAAGSVAFPYRLAGYGFMVTHSGNRNFSETNVSVATGRKLSDVFSAGIRFNYIHYRQIYFGGRGAVGYGIGLVLKMTESLVMSASLDNFLPFGSGALPPGVSELAMGYQAGDQLYLWMKLRKEISKTASLGSGFQYVFDSRFFIRCMMSTVPGQFLIGPGFRMNQYNIQFSVSHHQQLGFTPGLLLGFQFGKEKDTP